MLHPPTKEQAHELYDALQTTDEERWHASRRREEEALMAPKQYEDIRDSYERRGKPVKEAKKLAAMTYIARGKGKGGRSARAKSLQSGK